MSWLIAGFGDLGHAIARGLLADPRTVDQRVVALKRTPPSDPLPASVQWHQADLADPDSLRELPSDISHAIFCAAPNQRTAAAYEVTYQQGSQNLALALKRCAPEARLLFVSSTAVYGSALAGRVDEQSPTQPSEFNGQILLRAEQWLCKHDPAVLILRLSGIYGPNRQMLIRQIRAGQATVPASPDYWANRIHVDDAARAAIHLLLKPDANGVFIGTDSTPVPLRTLYTDLAHKLGAPEPLTGPASPMMGKKQLSNRKLLASGFKLKWPDSRVGYAAIVQTSS